MAEPDNTADLPANADAISKVNIRKVEDGRWEASVDYRNAEGKTVSGETQSFENFSLASAWVAGLEVDLPRESG